MEHFFATCPRGLEPVLAAELAALGAREVSAVDGGAAFKGDFALCYAANLESRLASRILWRIGRSPYRDEHDLRHAARALPWPRHFDVRRTLRVDTAAIRSPVKSLDFVTLRVKDAVCDAFRAAHGRRPDVATGSPEVRIHVFLTRDEATFYLDTSGEPLFRRGWRALRGEAPLRENLAAGILQLARWAPPVPLFDPMCGSGTFLVEAAMMALDIAPGLGRAFGFEKLENFDAAAWRESRERARARCRPVAPLAIYGSDHSGTALGLARGNLDAAGVAGAVTLKQMSMLDASPPCREPGVLVMNPPYGERTGSERELAAFYPRLGDLLKQRFAGWTACIFTADLRLPKLIRLTASRRTPLYNGPLECRLFRYEMVAGSRRRTPAASSSLPPSD
ncbi:MAG: class I SAM-dependent RNA methyltransferase [Burkholderiales bacterium]|nr:class I SAM-dependent RNA methyltransferase [Burkholderiales bacterium]